MLLPRPPASPRYLRLPFEISEDLGVGDAIKRVTAALGVPPCGGCQERAEALNARFVFRGIRP